MREFTIESGIVIDDMDSVIEGIREISGMQISGAETIRKFITSEKATKYYIDKKCIARMQPDRDTVYLWLDSGYTDRFGNSIMISLLRDNNGEYCGHYYGTMDNLAGAIRSFFPYNSKDISRNLSALKSKYHNKIAERNHRHIENEQEYLIMLCNETAGAAETECCTEFERLINGLNIQFDEPVEEPSYEPEESSVPEAGREPGFDMSFREKEITISLLLDTIDNMQDYIGELLAELKKSDEDREKLRELEQKNRDLEQALVDIRSFDTAPVVRAGAEGAEDATEVISGHDLLGRRGKILILGATPLDRRTMNGIAKVYGFKKEDFDYETDYSKIVSYASRIGNLDRYCAVILGAMPHKVQNLGDWSSLIEKCRNTPGLPQAIDARSRSGQLKVTKESFRDALLQICRSMKNAG